MRQSRKKWERKREEQRNKVIAVTVYCNDGYLQRGKYCNWLTGNFRQKKTGHWNRDLSLRFPVLKAEDG